MRTDLIQNSLWHDEKRDRLEPLVDAEISQSSLALYAEEEIALPPWVRLILGLRGDGYGFQVRDELEDVADKGGGTSGVAFASAVSPKGSLVVTVPEIVELYLNAGVGFHSNDARGVVRQREPVTPLTRAYGYEIGARSNLFGFLDVAGSAFGLNLDQETVWVGDEGTTELRGPTQRLGLEGRPALTRAA